MLLVIMLRKLVGVLLDLVGLLCWLLLGRLSWDLLRLILWGRDLRLLLRDFGGRRRLRSNLLLFFRGFWEGEGRRLWFIEYSLFEKERESCFWIRVLFEGVVGEDRRVVINSSCFRRLLFVREKIIVRVDNIITFMISI